MIWEKEIFREYDIRGVFNKQFDLDFAFELGKSYAKYATEKLGKNQLEVSIGYDARKSSPSICEAVSRGLAESGVTVHQMDLVTSPISYFSTFKFDHIDGSIMITGSHNPPEYNGFKISVGKGTISGEEIQQLRVIMEAKNYLTASGEIKKLDVLPVYLDHYKKEFQEIDPAKVVIDCGNGAAGCVVKDLFLAVGLEPIILFEEPDGNFPNHHPDPTVEKNLVDLKAAVKQHQAVAGIGFDGDADRIGVVDHAGNTILGDELMILYARDIVPMASNKNIIGDVKCSDRMYDEIAKIGGTPVMWKTGHSLVKQKIKEVNAPFGGELSGHIFFNDRNYGYDDAIYAALRLVEILGKTKKSIPELLEGVPSSFNTPEIRLDTTEQLKVSIVERLIEEFQSRQDVKLNLIDGLRVSYPDGWALARSSNTQPVLVMRFEANSEEALNRIRSEFESRVQELNS